MPKAQNYHGIIVLGIKRKDECQNCIQTVVVMMDICLRQTDKYPQPIKCALLFLTIECTFLHCLSSRNSDIYHALSSAKHLIGIPLTASAREHCLTMKHSETLCMFTECLTHQDENQNMETTSCIIYSLNFVDLTSYHIAAKITLLFPKQIQLKLLISIFESLSVAYIFIDANILATIG